jgi:arginine exporter protein ArgO
VDELPGNEAEYEPERAARKARRDAIARLLVAFFVAVALIFLAYDSLRALSAARASGSPWAWHAMVGGACLVGLGWLAVRARPRR